MGTCLEVITWNIGRINDFIGLYARTRTLDWKTPAELASRRTDLFKRIFKTMIQPDILCLQEVDETKEISEWLGPHYAVVGGTGDCLIAWKRERFKQVSTDWSTKEGRVLSLDLQETTTRKTIQVYSLHAPGFSLIKPEAHQEGTEFVQTVITRIDNTSNVVLFGTDLNATPTIGSERLSLFSSQGFSRVLDDRVTAYNPDLAERRAKLDEIFVRGARIVPIELSKEPKFPLESPKENPSDHRPVCRLIIID
jgi:hypothetical protein